MENLIEKKVINAIANLNAVLEECAKNNMGVAINVDKKGSGFTTTIYIHKDNKTEFSLSEIYK